MTELAATRITDADLRTVLDSAFEEAFERGMETFIDEGETIFDTLAEITAAIAVQDLGPRSSTIAGKVHHMCVYLEAMTEKVRTGTMPKVDWTGSWKANVSDDATWTALVERLRSDEQAIRQFVREHQSWTAGEVSLTISVAAHNVYHLGELRQALAAIRPNG